MGELELVMLLEDTSDSSHAAFTWHEVPPDDEWSRPRGVQKYLSLRSELAAAKALEAEVRVNPLSGVGESNNNNNVVAATPPRESSDNAYTVLQPQEQTER